MKRFFIISVFSLLFTGLYAQDPEFTQYYANPLYLNPAFAGTGGGPRFVLNYRDQWPSVPKSWVTFSASYDQHFDGLAGGIGFQVVNDQAGEGNFKRQIGTLVYSYQLNVSRKFAMKLALSAGVQKVGVDFSKLNFGDQIDAKLGFIYETREPVVLEHPGYYNIPIFPDFSFGILGYSNKMYGGLAVNHINQPKQSFLGTNSYLPMKYTAHFGLMLPLEDSREPSKFFSPNVLFQTQEKFWQLNIGAYFIRDKFMAGAWFRQTSANYDALMVLIGINAGPVKFCYSYDITFSEARYGAKGSHEASLIVQLPQPEHYKSTHWRKLQCPNLSF